MNTTTLRDLRANMKAHFDELEENQDVLLVPRSGNKEAIVIMTLSEYNSMKETEYLLSSHENAKVMEKSMRELEGNETVEFDISDK
ncbi:MAG: type II toxin-antitoxin system Phd/YefM family antitoxin [Cyclobacteriaceae bacterium]